MGLGWCLSRGQEQVWLGTLELKEAAEADELPWEAFPDAVGEAQSQDCVWLVGLKEQPAPC